jgi:hypothetical protein
MRREESGSPKEKLKASGLAEPLQRYRRHFFRKHPRRSRSLPLPPDHSRTDEQRIQTLSQFRNVIPANGKLLNR